ncbi:hypothetical protein MHTCC0001_20830 [Flavobacteriaceae bacterium MHTCC 0001]
MRKQYVLTVLYIMVCLYSGYGQILTVVEQHNGKTDTIAANGPQIVDINSNLEISISKRDVIEKIRADYPELSDQLDLQVRIDAIYEALDNQETILSLLKAETLNKTNKQELYAGLKDFYKTLTEAGNEDLRAQVNELSKEWRLKYGRNGISPNAGIKKEIYIYTNLNSELETAKAMLSNYEGGTFMISMLAYVYSGLGKNRVHIENFDTIAEHDIYTVPRWVTSLSETQEQQLQELQKRAENYNKEASLFFDSLKAELLSKLPDMSCVKTLKADIENFIGDGSLSSSIKTALEKDVKTIIDDIEGLNELLEFLTQDISSWTIQTPFKIMNSATLLTNSVEGLKEDMPKKFTEIATKYSSIRTRINTIGNNFNTCYNDIREDINGLTMAMGILKNQQDRFKDNDAISDEVKKFTISNLPSKGKIKLKRSGPRKVGDDLEIVLVLRRPSTVNALQGINAVPEQNQVIESHLLSMQLIGLRSETAVGIIMADSFNEKGFTPVEDRRFLYAPSVALLLKVGSRHSRLYNDFVDLGFGLSVSTPDFNTDGTPEFGAGFMFTAFKDILNVGINYNVTLDTPYWSFGINLPFNLPGLPINSPN